MLKIMNFFKGKGLERLCRSFKKGGLTSLNLHQITSEKNEKIKSSLMGYLSTKYNFSTRKNNGNDKRDHRISNNLKNNGNKEFKDKKWSQLARDIHNFLVENSKVQKIKDLNHCQNLAGFINMLEIFEKIMQLRNYIFEIKYQEINNTKIEELFTIYESIDENYGIAINDDNMDQSLKEIDFNNEHCHLAILAYFSEFFLLIPLLQKVSNSAQKKTFEKYWLEKYEALAYVFDKNLSTISLLKADDIFARPKDRFRFVIREEITNQFQIICHYIESEKEIQRYHVNCESAMIEEGITIMLKNYHSSKTFKMLAMKKVNQILERNSLQIVKDQQLKKMENGRRSILYLKYLLEEGKISNTQSRIPLVVQVNAEVLATAALMEVAFYSMGNGPKTTFTERLFDQVHAATDADSATGFFDSSGFGGGDNGIDFF